MTEALWSTLRLKGTPPVTRTAALLMGQQMTVSDAKARRQLGYVAHVTREAGLAELEAQPS